MIFKVLPTEFDEIPIVGEPNTLPRASLISFCKMVTLFVPSAPIFMAPNVDELKLLSIMQLTRESSRHELSN